MLVPPHEGLKLIASPDSHAVGHMHVDQDVKRYIGHESSEAELVYKIPKGRKLYLHMIRGEVRLEESHWQTERLSLYKGDGIGLSDKHDKLHFHAVTGVEFISFDLP
ncbi:MAG: redox-sensitive bicupin YhaK (pirin superfamily) [Alphaproteobacteria bacterium]